MIALAGNVLICWASLSPHSVVRRRRPGAVQAGQRLRATLATAAAETCITSTMLSWRTLQ
jgi:hypothetical protein